MAINSLVIIARHGEVSWNETGRLTSHTDLPLTERGKQQARHVGTACSKISLDRIISSPSQRATETAAIISGLQARPPQIEIDNRLQEIDFGPFEGQAPDELERGDLAQSFAAWMDERSPFFPSGAEDFAVAAARATEILSEVLGKGHILLITHGYLTRVMIATGVLGMPPAHLRRLRISNGRISVLTERLGHPQLLGLNVESLVGFGT